MSLVLLPLNSKSFSCQMRTMEHMRAQPLPTTLGFLNATLALLNASRLEEGTLDRLVNVVSTLFIIIINIDA